MLPALVTGYLTRVGLPAAGPPTLETLRRLHAAHVGSIPFENLDVLLGRGIHLDLDRLHDKLILRRRGGYCFEQNSLFLAVLRELGFDVTPMEARVLAGATAPRPRTHMVLVVDLDGAPWLADVGFGGEGLLEPAPLTGQVMAPAPGIAHRVVVKDALQVLQLFRDAAWTDQYAFELRPVQAVDFEVANWYTSTHPQSAFVRTLTAQRSTADARYVLRYPAFTEIRGGESRTRDISRGELLPLLREVFGIELPEGTTFPAIDAATPGQTSDLPRPR